MRFVICPALAVSLLMISSESYAQSSFATSEINRLSNFTSSNAYSSSAIQSQVYRSAVPRIPHYSGVSPDLFGGALGRPNKPFSSISRGPSVTPYLALDQPFVNSGTQYYTQVRPQLEQQILRPLINKIAAQVGETDHVESGISLNSFRCTCHRSKLNNL